MIKLYNGKTIARNQFDVINQHADIPAYFQTPDNYNEFLLSCLSLLFTDNLFFYQIPKSFKLYSNTEKLSKLSKNKTISLYFNAIDVNSPVVYEHTVIQPIRVVAFDKKTNCDILIATAINAGLIGMDQIFKNGDVDTMSQYLCSMGIYGFITKFSNKLPYTFNLCHKGTISHAVLFQNN